jgi:starch synthase
MKILFVAAEVAPFAKVGGLADVAGALPKSLCALGHDVRVIMPRYGSVDGARYGLRDELDGSTVHVPGSSEAAGLQVGEMGEVPVYFVANDRHLGRDNVYGYPDDTERFLYFCRAALAAVDALGWTPDVVHVNDWHTAVIPHWLRGGYDLPASVRGAASVITIHNLAYQGGFDPALYPREWIDPGALDRVGVGPNLLAQGIASADLVTTVSERYAEEITQPDYGEGLDGLLRQRSNELRGIINGIDYEVFDPANDPAIAAPYSADNLEGKDACKAALQREVGFDLAARTPLIGIVGRLADQKGFDLVAEIAQPFLAEVDAQIVMLGTGEPRYHDLFRELAAHNRRQLSVDLKFDAGLAQRIYAGADMFLMPSRFEPCGLGQLISLRYGTVPIVRSTGGLADTVADYQPATRHGTGFVFREYQPVALTLTIGRALGAYRDSDRWREIQLQGMQQDLSWKRSAEKYGSAYDEVVERRGSQR